MVRWKDRVDSISSFAALKAARSDEVVQRYHRISNFTPYRIRHLRNFFPFTLAGDNQ